MKLLIGNTPMIKINYRYQNQVKSVYTKLEYFNLTGSIKDRIAHDIITKAKEKQELCPGAPIIEATSGNTGISFAALGSYYHHPVIIFMPDWASKERIKLMKLYGADVKLVSKEEGGFLECIKRAKELAEKTNGYTPNQFANPNNVLAHYQKTAAEILNQLPEHNRIAFVSGIGTGGTLMGVGKRLKEENKENQVIAIEPKGSSILKCNDTLKEHAIEGIGDGLIPEILEPTMIDNIYLIEDDDAVNMSRKLALQLGLAVGISSGANLLGAIEHQKTQDVMVVTVFPDDNKKYLSTRLSEPIDLKKDFLSNQIELLDYEIIAGCERSVL